MQRKELYERKRSRGTTCATRKVPQKVSISRGLESLQKMVGGYISFTYPFKEDVGIVLNDEGKLLGLPFNRALRDENGNPYDIINGDFLVVGLTDDDISSLSPELTMTIQMRLQKKIFCRIVFITMMQNCIG